VIQGSVLGPILFILFIADLNDYLPTGVSFAKYADDIVGPISSASSPASTTCPTYLNSSPMQSNGGVWTMACA
jgi:hypothetical protein